jgi:hypothetical protein
VTDVEEARDFQAMLDEANAAYDEMCRSRHAKGQEVYGPLKFMEVNTLEQAMEEIADMANYARYTWLKLWFLNQQVDKVEVQSLHLMGSAAFMKSGGK